MSTAISKLEPSALQAPSVPEMMSQVLTSDMSGAEKAHVIKELALVLQSQERFTWEREERQAKIDFDDALKVCQKAIARIVPDKEREKGIKWATYTAIDNEIRPIYTSNGFAISFSQETASGPGRMAVAASLTRSGISRDFRREVPIVAPGATSAADAEEAAYSRAQRYIVLRIFNISVGMEAAEMKPYETKPEDLMDESTVMDFCAAIEGSGDVDELKRNYLAATKAGANDPSALRAFDKAKKETWKKRGFKA